MEQEDLELIIQRYKDMVYRLAFGYMQSREDAEDVFQDVFLKYMEHAGTFKDEEHKKAWLIRITINHCKSLLRSSWFRKRLPLNDEISITKDISNNSSDSQLEWVLMQLKPTERQIIHLYYYEELSIKEISNLISLSESVIQTRLLRIRKKLAKLLKEEERYVQGQI